MTAAIRSLGDLVRWLELAPASTTIGARDLAQMLEPLADAPTSTEVAPAPATTWREKLWTVAPETRLGLRELAEALDRPVSFVYRHTSEKAAGVDRLPHRKLDGELVFVVAEIRAWISEHEEVIAKPGVGPPRRLGSTAVRLHR